MEREYAVKQENETPCILAPDGGLLQSEQWRTFQGNVGAVTFVVSGEGYYANVLRRGRMPLSFLYVPRGPLAAHSDAFLAAMTMLQESARAHRAGWIRIEPQSNSFIDALRAKRLMIRHAPHAVQPRAIFAIPISGDDATLFAAMHPKTRYNIRLALKKELSISTERTQQDCDAFVMLARTTLERRGLRPHTTHYYRAMLRAFPESAATLFVAYDKERPIAAIFVIKSGDTAIYLHGGSAARDRSLMAPYLLHWTAIRYFRDHACVRYNFEGVTASSDPHDPWAGITRFKRGFNTHVDPIVFPGTMDVVLSPSRYLLYRALWSMRHALSLIRRS